LQEAAEPADPDTTGRDDLTQVDLSNALLDLLDEGVWAIDPLDATILSANRTAATTIGARAGELVGTSFLDLVEPRLTADGWHLLLDHLEDGRTHHVHVGLSTRHGVIEVVELTLARTHTVHHDVVMVRSRPVQPVPTLSVGPGSGPDLLTEMISALRDGVAVVDSAGRIIEVNDAFCRLVGRTREQIRSSTVFDPPWALRDAHGHEISAEESPAATCLRTGSAAVGDLWSSVVSRTDRAHVRMAAHRVTDGAIIVLEDLTDEVDRSGELAGLRDVDELTGLRSRRWIHDHLAEVLAGGADELRRVGVLHVDLDNFRTINDTFGSSTGDIVLVEMARRVQGLADERVRIGRVGVDEMVIVVTDHGPSLSFDGELRRLADEIQRQLHMPLAIHGLELRLTASIGVSRAPVDAHGAERLLAAAERALTAGRLEGRNRLRFYEPELDAATRTGLALDRDLRRAAASRQLEVHYQPIIDLRTGSVVMAEALVRWHHPEEGPIPPSVFIPTAEATGAISAVSDLVLSTVARDVAVWSQEQILPPRARIAVNISPTEFEQRDFTDRLAATLAAEGVSPSQIELEITESLLVQDLRAAATRLEQLDDLGFLIALDDFGTGYSSLSYLHSLPFHTLKIDRRFVGDLRDDRSGTITRAILTLAHNLGIVAVAEGVETDGQRRFLSEAGCDLVQGFLYAPPLPRVAFERFLAEHSGTASPVTPDIVLSPSR